MSIQIKLKNSVVQDSTPSTSDLPAVGEIALNANINSIGGFMRASNNTIVKIFGPGSLTTPTATTTVSGISELATNTETTTGTATNRVVTPAGLNAVTVAERTTSNNNYVAKAGSTLTGVLTMPNGSNSAPAINFGDSDSGIFGGTNTVSLAAGGTTRLTADTGVSVVGTLAVTGAITSTSDLTIADKIIHAGDTNTAIRFPAADTVSIETGGSEALRVDSSRRLLVGNSSNVASRTNASSFSPQLQLSSDTEAAVSISRYSNSVNPSRLALQKGRGTIASKAIVLDNDTLGEIIFSGWDGDTFTNGAKIEAQVNGTPGDDDMPGCLIFKTTADGSAVPTERLRIDSNGDIYTSGDQVRDNARLTLEKNASGIITLLNLHNSSGSGTGTRISSNKALVLSADFDSNTPSTQSFIAFETDSTEKIRITQDGSLAIGTTSSSTKLHVVTPSLNTSSLDTTNCLDLGLRIFAGSVNNTTGDIQSGITLGEGRAGLYAYDDGGAGANGLGFWTGSNSGVAERVRITSTGNAGVGTLNPAGKVHANSATNTATFLAEGETDNPSYPAYGFAGQNADNGSRGTGMYLAGDGRLAFATHGSERIRFDENGDIFTSGGSVLNNARLTVTKNASGITTALCVHNASGDGSKISSTRSLVLAADFDANSGAGESYISFETDATEKIRITAEGQLAIGTSTPSQNLHVIGNVLVENNLGNVLTIRSTVNNGNDPNIYLEKARGGGTPSIVQDNDDLGDIRWRGYDGNSYEDGARIFGEVDGTPADGDMPTRLVIATRASGGATPQGRVNITSNGNIGIGSNVAPGVLFDIGGVSSAGLNGLTNSVFYAGFANNTNFGGVVLGPGVNGNTPFIAASKKSNGVSLPLDVYTDGTHRVRFNAGDGNVSIGATVSKARLYIKGSGTGSAASAIDVENSNSVELFKVKNDGSFATGIASGSPINFTGGSANAHIDSNGRLRTVSSSKKYKVDITNALWGLAEVLKLRPVTFKYKTQSKEDKKYAGFTAEELHDLGLKDFVDYRNNQPDSINYPNMVALMAKAIQELNAKITNLEAA